MVDPTKGITGIQNLPSSNGERNKTEQKRSDTGGATSSATPVEVTISEEARSLASAEQFLQNIKSQLQNNQGLSLSNNSSALEDMLA